MSTLKIFQVDAFADKLFTGNPAAVCLLDEWLNDSVLQSIAAENNLAETAFVVTVNNEFQIRWFTPTVEVDLCGHATLASAYVFYEKLKYSGQTLVFNSPRSGKLMITKQTEYLFLNFPVDNVKECNCIAAVADAIGVKPLLTLIGNTDMVAVLNSEEEVRAIVPNLQKVSALAARGLIVTAPGTEVDFVSRFFGPQVGINEDPVTGSAHTSLIPLWSKRLKKDKMIARQLSERGGELICENYGDRVLIGGKAQLYMEGIIYL